MFAVVIDEIMLEITLYECRGMLVFGLKDPIRQNIEDCLQIKEIRFDFFV